MTTTTMMTFRDDEQWLRYSSSKNTVTNLFTIDMVSYAENEFLVYIECLLVPDYLLSMHTLHPAPKQVCVLAHVGCNYAVLTLTFQ